MSDAEARRAARKAELEAQRKAQHEIDIEALDALEVEHGDSSVEAINVPFTPGLPTMVIVRAPKQVELKRYRDMVKPRKNGEQGDSVAAAEALASLCLLYPDRETFAKICDARPGVHAQSGATAIQLAVGKSSEEAKG